MCTGITTAMATSTFYYAANAYASPTGGGKVYVSSTSTSTPSYQQSPHGITGSQRTVGYGEVTLYYYAKANDGFIFDHWSEGSGDGEAISTNSSYTAQGLQFRSTDSGNRTTFNYCAVFKAQTGQIKVKSADESKGGVSISNPDNEMGDEVTLTANPDVSNGVMFLGWKKDNTGDYVSTNNPLVLTANSETKGTYWAYFSDPATKVYIRLKNNKTGRFLSFYGTGTGPNKNKVSDHTRDFEYNGRTYPNVKDGFKFEESFKMIDATDAQGNPSTVFLRSGHGQGTGVTKGVDFSAHGVAYSSLVGANTSQEDGKYMLTMEGDGSSVRIYTTYTVSVSGRELDLPTYLFDEEGEDYAVMRTIQGLSQEQQRAAEWTLYSLDETTTAGAFGANTKAKFTKDGKYYTTMYTDFPYQLLDGVNAYYLVFNEEFTDIVDRVVFTPVNGKKVAANTAVILECPAVQNDITSTDVVTNRLLPLTKDYPAETVNSGLNFLKGYISVNGSTVANQDNFYVLSSNKDGVLGFYPYSKSTMTPNKAYLDVRVSDQTVVEQHAKNVTFYFGEPEENTDNSQTTRIELSNQIVDEDDSTPVYNLNGSKVAEGKAAENLLRPGVYVKKGKKFVVK
ncbi:MAG: hypothetical protein IKW98_13400 [Prevotella sp.]|nr:hypothetical protein [Prevotella sp.]